MAEIGSLEFTSLSPASSIRQRARYSIGAAPTVCLNLSAKIERDMPARSASSWTVQPCAGSSCIALIAALICGSASAKSHPTPPLNPSAKCSQGLHQHHGCELLRNQKAARFPLAQFLHHPLERPAHPVLCRYNVT